MPQDDNSSAQKLNCNEFIEFDDEADSIRDQPCSIKIISVASDTSLCIW